MNLIGDPWIPVVMWDGKAVMKGLAALFKDAESIHDLVMNPLQRIAIMRLLIGITQAALDGPQDEDDWAQSRDRIQSAVQNYLQKQWDAFELFGPRPFLQVPTTQINGIQYNATIDKLDFTLASGNNPTLFDHQANEDGRQHSPAWLALNLITYQCFDPGGLTSQVEWNGMMTQRSANQAPCAEGSMIHLFIQRDNLLDTIHMNLLTRELVAATKLEWGKPVWEITSDYDALKNTYLGRLTPLSRLIALKPDSTRIMIAEAIRFPGLPTRDPFGTVIANKKEELTYIGIRAGRHPWRDLHAVLSLGGQGKTGGPLVLEHVNNQGSTMFELWTGGLFKSKAKLLGTPQWIFRIHTTWLGKSMLNLYESGVKLADTCEIMLKKAVKAYASKLTAEAGPFSKPATSYYWYALDARHEELEHAVDQGSLDEWEKAVRSVMHLAYEYACPHIDARQIQAFAWGRKHLHCKLSQNSQNEEEEE